MNKLVNKLREMTGNVVGKCGKALVVASVAVGMALTPSASFATEPTDISTLTNAAVTAITGKGAPTVTIFQAVIGFVALLAIGALIVGLIRRK